MPHIFSAVIIIVYAIIVMMMLLNVKIAQLSSGKRIFFFYRRSRNHRWTDNCPLLSKERLHKILSVGSAITCLFAVFFHRAQRLFEHAFYHLDYHIFHRSRLNLRAIF